MPHLNSAGLRMGYKQSSAILFCLIVLMTATACGSTRTPTPVVPISPTFEFEPTTTPVIELPNSTATPEPVRPFETEKPPPALPPDRMTAEPEQPPGTPIPDREDEGPRIGGERSASDPELGRRCRKPEVNIGCLTGGRSEY